VTRRGERLRRHPRAQTREHLLDAAARVFAERGFHGASVEAVSEEAGYSTGALYSNFSGKEDLFLRLYEERVERRRRELREAAGQDGLAALAGAVAGALRHEREFFLLWFEFALHGARNPRFGRRLEAVRAEGLAELAAGLADGFERAGIETAVPAEDLARALRALTFGLALDGLLDEDAVTPAFVQRLFETGVAGLRG
jgi:AcrR family transcriptional regulator